jgi:hypothetical protein
VHGAQRLSEAEQLAEIKRTYELLVPLGRVVELRAIR